MVYDYRGKGWESKDKIWYFLFGLVYFSLLTIGLNVFLGGTGTFFSLSICDQGVGG